MTVREALTLPYLLVALIVSFMVIGMYRSTTARYSEIEASIVRATERLEDYWIDVFFSAIFWVLLVYATFFR